MFIDIDFDPADAEKSTYTEADGAEEKEAMEADTREVQSGTAILTDIAKN